MLQIPNNNIDDMLISLKKKNKRKDTVNLIVLYGERRTLKYI